MMVALTIARCKREGKELSNITLANIDKVTKFRKDGMGELERMVKRVQLMNVGAKAE